MINCPNCGASGEAGANYCVRCGRRLPTVCPNCGAANLVDSRFCHSCGTGLGTGAPTAFPSPLAVSCPRCHADNEPGATFCYSCGLPLDEFGGSKERPTTAEGTPAGFWIRLLAWLIDSIVLLTVQMALLTILPGTSIEAYFLDESLWTWYDSFMALVGVAYYTVGVSVFSTTVGKRVLGLYVMRSDGSKITPLRAFARYVAYIPSALFLGVGYLMIGFSSDKRGLHDHLCDTVVVKRRRG